MAVMLAAGWSLLKSQIPVEICALGAARPLSANLTPKNVPIGRPRVRWDQDDQFVAPVPERDDGCCEKISR